ncbi:phosphatidate cytidylyltransferase [Niabella insulamsoli]|uniref:phosphatidate cytidylyltransferase n=1 Tax=Niabella insulamsoli TaxID=3144874 RepID=UPI0031FC4DCC
MAFNWSTFWTRAFTALIFVAIMMFGLLHSSWSLFVLLSVIYFGCWREYAQLTEKITAASLHRYGWLGAALIGYHFFLLLSGDLQLAGYGVQENFSLPFLIAGLVLFIWGLFKTPVVSKPLLFRLLAGWLYIAVPLGLLDSLLIPTYDVHVHDTMFVIGGQSVVLFIFGSIWINDTMAYLCGSLYGKTPLTKISPKKTWEGTLSGIILSAALTWLLYTVIFLKSVEGKLAVVGVIISFITAVAGTFGDLFESKLKRMAGVKDSGRIMPGHGGFLDRFDSILFAAPAIWLFVRIFYG